MSEFAQPNTMVEVVAEVDFSKNMGQITIDQRNKMTTKILTGVGITILTMKDILVALDITIVITPEEEVVITILIIDINKEEDIIKNHMETITVM